MFLKLTADSIRRSRDYASATHTRAEARGCMGKIDYSTEAEARMAARKTGALKGGTLEPYHCLYQDHWHIATRRSHHKKREAQRST